MYMNTDHTEVWKIPYFFPTLMASLKGLALGCSHSDWPLLLRSHLKVKYL